jgi:hypothetical protein
VDLDTLGERVVALLTDDALRERMGQAGRNKVARTYVWSRVIPRYEAIWDELAAAARAVATDGPARNPYSLGPGAVFAHYPSGTLDSATTLVATVRHADEAPFRDTGAWLRGDLLDRVLELATPSIVAGDLIGRIDLPPGQTWFAVAWLMKYGFLAIQPTTEGHRSSAAADSPV